MKDRTPSRSLGLAPITCRRGGFTLIELLVVISIISLLISILLPALGRARETAQSASCLARERQMGLAAHAYYGDNGYHPVNFRRDVLLGGGSYPHPMDFMQQLGPYTQPGQGDYSTHNNGIWSRDNAAGVNFYLCPGGGYQPSNVQAEIRKTAFILPGWRVGNYAVNAFFGYREFDRSAPFGGSPKREIIDSASNVPLLGEGRNDSSWGADYLYTVISPDPLGSGLYPHPGGTTNILFLDGHAANVGNYDRVVEGYQTGQFNFRPARYY